MYWEEEPEKSEGERLREEVALLKNELQTTRARYCGLVEACEALFRRGGDLGQFEARCDVRKALDAVVKG